MRAPAAALLFLAGCAAPAAAPVLALAGPSATALGAVDALPAELSGFRREGPVIDYDRLAPGGGLGASVR